MGLDDIACLPEISALVSVMESALASFPRLQITDAGLVVARVERHGPCTRQSKGLARIRVQRSHPDPVYRGAVSAAAGGGEGGRGCG